MQTTLIPRILISVSCMCAPLAAQTYLNEYRTPSRGDQPNAIQILDDGSSVIASLSIDDLNVLSTLMRVDRFGQVLWYRVYEELSFVNFSDVLLASDGAIIVAGAIESSPAIAKIQASDGQMIWAKRLDLQGRLNAVVEDSNGTLIAVGGHDSQGALVAEFSSSGAIQQIQVYGSSTHSESANDVVIAADGGLVIVGHANDSGFKAHAFKVNQNRQVEWSSVFGEANTTTGRRTALARATSGGFFVLSGENTGGLYDNNPWILRLDEDGQTLWTAVYDSGTAIGRDIHATEDGGCVVIGDSANTIFGDRSIWLFKLQSDGTIDWEHDVSRANDNEFGFALDVSPYGGIVAAGSNEHATRVGLPSPWLLRVEGDGEIETPCVPYIHDHSSRVPLSATGSPWTISRDLPSTSTVNITFNVTSLSTTVNADCESCSTNFSSFGLGLPGSGGIIPVLEGQRGSCDGSTPRMIDIRDGLGGATAFLFIGAGLANIPFLDGTLYVSLSGPFVIIALPLTGTPGTPGDGATTLTSSSDRSDILGIPLYFQALIEDPGASRGFSFTNGMEMVVGN